MTNGWAAVVVEDWIELSEKIPKERCQPTPSFARGFYQSKGARTEAAKHIKKAVQTLCNDPVIMLKAKKSTFEGQEGIVPKQSPFVSSGQLLPQKRKLSPLARVRTGKRNCTVPATHTNDETEDWSFLNDYINSGSKQSEIRGDATSLIDALDKC